MKNNQTKTEPVAILISDIHYNINTLKVADKALTMAIDKANELNVHLVVAGDLHDTKANLRGECISAMIKTFKQANIKPIVLVGNHDKINEKSEDHSLEFLRSYVTLVDKIESVVLSGNPVTLIPYQNDPEVIKQYLCLKQYAKGAVIMHQGVSGSTSGEYIQDKTALSKDDLAGLRVISGHYHTRQSFELPKGGRFDYIGNPYTLGFGEANDPVKGYQILYPEGVLEFIPTNLRRHRIIEMGTKIPAAISWIEETDIVWVKVSAKKEELRIFTKDKVSKMLNIEQDFKLELISLETTNDKLTIDNKLSKGDLLDKIIDSYDNTSKEVKQRVKHLWKSL